MNREKDEKYAIPPGYKMTKGKTLQKCSRCNRAIKKPLDGEMIQKGNTIIKELWRHRWCVDKQIYKV